VITVIEFPRKSGPSASIISLYEFINSQSEECRRTHDRQWKERTETEMEVAGMLGGGTTTAPSFPGLLLPSLTSFSFHHLIA